MKSKHLLLMLLLAVFAPWAANAQEPVPYNEGFESMSSEADLTAAGWISDGASGCYIGITTSYYNTGSKALLISAWNGSSNSDSEVAALPVLNAPVNTLQITLAYRQRSGGTVKVGYLTDADDASTFVSLESLASSTSGFTTTTVDLSAAPATAARIAIQQYTWYDCYIDDIVVTTLPTCPKPTLSSTVETTQTTATLSWTPAEGHNLFDIYWSTTNTAPTDETTPLAANQSGTSYKITGLTAATTYYAWIRGNCGTATDPDISGGWTSAVSFTTECDIVTVPTDGWTENFDDLEVASAYTAPSTRVLPTCWNAINTTSYATYAVFPSIYYYSYTNYANSTPNCLKFYSYYSSYGSYDPQPQYAILPEMDNLDGMRIKLWARGYNATSTFKIGRMTDPEDASTFVAFEIETGVYEQALTTSYQEFTYEITGTGNYLAIMIDAATSSNSTIGVYIDDIRVEPIPSCTEPTDLECTATTTTTATLSWTAGGTETAWDIYVSTENTAPTATTTPTVSATTDNPATVPGLTAATTYYAWVRAHCSDSDQSPWIGGISFDTDCDAVTTFPWSENFESYNAGDFSALCWVNEHLVSVSNRTDVFKVYTTTNGTNTTHQLQLPDMQAGNITKLRLPEMTLPNANYQFTIDFYRNDGNYGSYTTEGISVFASTDGEIEGATLLAFIPRPHSTSNSTGITTIPNETAAGWYTYELPIGFSGTCYIILRGESQYGAASYMDNFIVEQVPTCKKPSALMLETPSSRTAHTATLKWTNGAEGQNAWQIAYSTVADFDPNTVTPVDVTTNPATIEGLTQSTTYYAYVRANCGGGDYSAWCNNKVTFSTLAGNVTPTGLAVDAASITSDEATASWNAVAGNTLHEYYQIYWAEATVTSVPDEPAAPNLITNITATSQLISSLDAETEYKVWVRDICGDDGNSAWSSAVTFTTASACQTPDGIDADDVTNNSASITWNTYGLSEFNLRYGTDGENWTVKNNVNTPYGLTELTGNTTYQLQVQAVCNTEEWSTAFSFTTDCDAVTTFPWSENFNSLTAGIPDCWDNSEGTTTNASYKWNYYASGYDGAGLRFNSYNNSNNLTNFLKTPVMNLPAGTTMQLVFWYKNPTGGDFSVYISTDGGTTYTTELATGLTSQTTWTEKVIELNDYVGAENVVIVFKGTSNYGNGDAYIYLDDVTVEPVPTCLKPSAVTKSDVTNHSATLSWTNGEEGQEAWQIAYKAGANFDPTDAEALATATVIDVTANPYTFDKTLDAATTYYMYVRANCGGGDYSKWVALTGNSLTTSAATPAPSAFTASNFGAQTVDLVWNAGGGDFETSWDLYYVASETAPEAPTATTEATKTVSTLPTTEAPYTLTGLTAETKYYIWVRANHGTDGLSAWVALTGNFFETTPACSALDPVVSNITHHNATVTWNGESADGFTVNYREAAGTDAEFSEDFENGIGSWTMVNCASSTGINGNAAHSGSNGFRFYFNSNPPQYLISPVLTGDIDGKNLEFYYKQYSSNWPETFKVGYSSTTSSTDAFTFGDEITMSDTDWHLFSETVPAGTKYLCIQYTSNNQYYLYIDDITIGAFEIPAGNWQTQAATTTSADLTGLTAGTKYDLKVVPNCDATLESSTVQFTTLDGNTKYFLTEGDWNTTTNWMDGEMPAITDNAILRANATINNGIVATAKKITFQSTPTPTLTIADGGQLQTDNTVTATVKKNIAAYPTEGKAGYYLIGSPLSSTIYSSSFSGIGLTNSDGTYDLYQWSRTSAQEWSNYKAGSFSLYNGTGYLYANAANVELTFTGAVKANNTPETKDASYTEPTGETQWSDWNLFANPFVCDAYITDVNANESETPMAFYRMNTAGDGFETATGAIKPMEGIFVQATKTGQSFKFSRTAPVTSNGNGNLNITMAQVVTTRDMQPATDNAIVRFGEGNTLEKFSFREGSSKVYIPQDGKDYAVVNAGKVGELPLNFMAEKNGAYTLSFNSENVDFSYLHLIDNMTGNDVDLLANPSYTFDARYTDYASRFRLVFATGTSVEGDSFGFINGSGNLCIFGIDGTATLQVIDVMGRILSSETFSGNYEKKLNGTAGVYMLRLINGNDIKVQKIVVR